MSGTGNSDLGIWSGTYQCCPSAAVKQRMRSVTNIQKITKAMKMVAASKLRVAQAATMESRGIISPLVRLLGDLPGEHSNNEDCQSSRTAQGTRIELTIPAGADVEKNLTVPITSDKGLCGGINSTVTKYTRGTVKTFSGGGSLAWSH